MPPSRVKIERISTDRTRQNTFHKRKLGLIKKAIELTILCDCDCAVLLRNGPTEMNKEGTLLAYCNKDLVQLLQDFMGHRPMNIYTNKDYNRFAKGAQAGGDEAEASVIFDDRAMDGQLLPTGSSDAGGSEETVPRPDQLGNFSQGLQDAQHHQMLKRGYDIALGNAPIGKNMNVGYERSVPERGGNPHVPVQRPRHGGLPNGGDQNADYQHSNRMHQQPSAHHQPPHSHPHSGPPDQDGDPDQQGVKANRDIGEHVPYSPHLQHQGHAPAGAGLSELHQFTINNSFHHSLLDDSGGGGRGLNDLPLFGTSVSQDESDKHDYWTWSI